MRLDRIFFLCPILQNPQSYDFRIDLFGVFFFVPSFSSLVFFPGQTSIFHSNIKSRGSQGVWFETAPVYFAPAWSGSIRYLLFFPILPPQNAFSWVLTYLMLFFWAELIRPRDAATLIIYPSVFRWCSTRPLCVTMWFCVSCCGQTVIGGAAMGRNNNKTAPSHSLLYWGRVQRRMSLQHREI